MKKEKVLKYIIIGSTAAVIIMMAAATVIEKLYGSAQALSLVYHSPVFIALWAVAAISGVTLMLLRHTIRKPFTFLLHISLVLILAGALLTMLTGTSGIMELRRGETSAQWISDQGMRQKLPFKITLNDFSIEYYPGTKSPSDYISKVTLSDSGSGISSSTAATGSTSQATTMTCAAACWQLVTTPGAYRQLIQDTYYCLFQWPDSFSRRTPDSVRQ